MRFHSTREAAKKLGIPHSTLATYLAVGKIPEPKSEVTGRTTTQIWTDEEIEHVRKLLPKIANGRKTRYKKKQKKHSAVSTQQSAKAKSKTKTRNKKKT